MNKLIGNYAEIYDENLYFTVFGLNVLGRIDLNKNNTKYIMGPQEEKFVHFMPWGGIAKWNNKIIIVPYNTKSVWAYDNFVWEKLTEIIMPSGYMDYRFMGLEICGDNLFLIGHNYSNLLCINLNDKTCKNVFDANVKETPNWIRFFAQSKARVDNTLYLANHLTNHIVIFDMDTLQYEWKRVGDDNRKNVGIIHYKEDFWIIPTSSNHSLIRWNEEKGIGDEYEISVGMKNIWGAAEHNDMVYFYGPKEKTIVFDIRNHCFRNTNLDIRYVKETDGCLLWWNDDSVLQIRNDKETKRILTFIDTDEMNSYIKSKSEIINKNLAGDIISESTAFSLKNYIALM